VTLEFGDGKNVFLAGLFFMIQVVNPLIVFNKRNFVIAFWDVGNAIAFLGDVEMRSFFENEGFGGAIAFWGCWKVRSFFVGVRSLFGDVGVRSRFCYL
jgi:hypothetical protein